MPLYNFECKNCNTIFEAVEHIGIEVSLCPKCDNLSEKIFSPTRFCPPRPFICYDLEDKPVQIQDFRHLEKECQKRGLGFDVGPTKYSKRETPRNKLRKRIQKANEIYANT